MNKTIILFTEAFPFLNRSEITFIQNELPYLLETFERVILVPKIIAGEQTSLPARVSVDKGVAYKKRSLRRFGIIFLKAVTSRFFYREIIRKPWILLHWTSLRSLFDFVGTVELIRKWTADYIQSDSCQLDETIFYTFWLREAAFGVGLVKRDHDKMILISRAHGFDLYEERFNPPYIPLRDETISKVDRVFIVSQHGKAYLGKRYPLYSNKFEVSRLGVHNPQQYNHPSQDGKFRVLSCSTMNKIKRLELLIYGLDELVSSHPHLEIVWTHIGTGSLFSKTQHLAEKTLGDKVQVCFLGDIPNDEVHRFYRENPVDLFVNVSRWEGVPVSIMEALSYGVPVMATAVGGIPEIVSATNGKLLHENPTPEQIAEGIHSFIESPELTRQKRGASIKFWKNEFNAKINYAEFIKSLKPLAGNCPH